MSKLKLNYKALVINEEVLPRYEITYSHIHGDSDLITENIVEFEDKASIKDEIIYLKIYNELTNDQNDRPEYNFIGTFFNEEQYDSIVEKYEHLLFYIMDINEFIFWLNDTLIFDKIQNHGDVAGIEISKIQFFDEKRCIYNVDFVFEE